MFVASIMECVFDSAFVVTKTFATLDESMAFVAQEHDAAHACYDPDGTPFLCIAHIEEIGN